MGFERASWLNVALTELRIALDLMLPMMLKCYVGCGVSSVVAAFIGHYDTAPDHIAGALLGRTFSNVTGKSVGFGIALGLQTLISQNNGKGANFENAWVMRQCNKALLICLIFSSLCALFSKDVLTALDQPQGVLVPCQWFSMVSVLSLPFAWFSMAVGSSLLCQGVVRPGVVFDTFGALLNIGLAYVFLRFGNMGYMGIPWANVVSSIIAAGSLYLYVVLSKRQSMVWRTLPRPDGARTPITLTGYMSVALPSAFTLWAEWWAGEIQAVIAGWLPNGEIATGANGLIFTLISMCYMTFVAAQTATTARVGNLVGAKDAKRIPIAIAVVVLLSLVLSAAVALVLQIWGCQLLRLYTEEPGILNEAFKAKIGMVLCIVPYSVAMSLLGALRGAGLQRCGAVYLAIAFYVIGIPAGAYMGLRTELGLCGIWLGNALGLTLAALAMGLRVCLVDWDAVVARATLMAGETLSEPLHEDPPQAPSLVAV